MFPTKGSLRTFILEWNMKAEDYFTIGWIIVKVFDHALIRTIISDISPPRAVPGRVIFQIYNPYI